MSLTLDATKFVTIDYTNYRGERAVRTVMPVRTYFGSTEQHPEPTWLLKAYDLDRCATRHFATKDIHGPWVPKTLDYD